VTFSATDSRSVFWSTSQVLAVTCILGCSGGAADTNACPVGDLGAAAELELFHQDDRGTAVPTQAMDAVELVQPPQGGWVFYVIPHVRNMNGCELQLSTSLIDTISHQIIVFESRPVSLTDEGTGWGEPANVSGDGLVAACPQAMAMRDLDENPYTLDVVALDGAGRRAESMVDVVPTCSDPFCRCQCDHLYHLGDNCSTPVDGGVDGAPLDGVDAGSRSQ
jgi:hypothetical protein